VANNGAQPAVEDPRTSPQCILLAPGVSEFTFPCYRGSFGGNLDMFGSRRALFSVIMCYAERSTRHGTMSIMSQGKSEISLLSHDSLPCCPVVLKQDAWAELGSQSKVLLLDHRLALRSSPLLTGGVVKRLPCVQVGLAAPTLPLCCCIHQTPTH